MYVCNQEIVNGWMKKRMIEWIYNNTTIQNKLSHILHLYIYTEMYHAHVDITHTERERERERELYMHVFACLARDR